MKEYITINGREYNTRTGEFKGASNTIHNSIQKSTPLNRKFLKPPKKYSDITPQQYQAISQFKRKHDYSEAILKAEKNRSADLYRFSSKKRVNVQPIAKSEDKDEVLIPPQEHPLQKKANEALKSAKQGKTLPTARELKILAINEALDNSRKNKYKHDSFFVKGNKGILKYSSILGFITLAICFLVYTNMPNIAVKLVSAQSGIEVNMPSYTLEGYSSDGLASFDGENIIFKYKNNNGYHYEIKEMQKEWDSVALRENHIYPRWGDNYNTAYSNGIIIYSKGNEYIWVNNGRMYTVTSNMSISDTEISNIVKSL